MRFLAFLLLIAFLNAESRLDSVDLAGSNNIDSAEKNKKKPESKHLKTKDKVIPKPFGEKSGFVFVGIGVGNAFIKQYSKLASTLGYEAFGGYEYVFFNSNRYGSGVRVYASFNGALELLKMDSISHSFVTINLDSTHYLALTDRYVLGAFVGLGYGYANSSNAFLPSSSDLPFNERFASSVNYGLNFVIDSIHRVSLNVKMPWIQTPKNSLELINLSFAYDYLF